MVFSPVLAGFADAGAPGERSEPEKFRSRKGPRKLAPGVLTVVAPGPQESDTFSGPREFVEIVQGIPELDWTPDFTPKSYTLKEIAKKSVFRHSVWQLEFAFKPVRMIEVDVPQPTGKMRRKRIWYMVYRVTNRGYHLQPVAEEDKWGHETFDYDRINHTIRFFPHLVLESREYEKSYLDRIIPAAMRPIQQREDPNLRFYNSVQISTLDIGISTEKIDRGVWGVATWMDIDPRIDFFSVFVKGLTNAFQFTDPPGAFQPGDLPGAGRSYATRTLQLNFWRPGDSIEEHEEEIRFGIPDEVDYRWIYR